MLFLLLYISREKEYNIRQLRKRRKREWQFLQLVF